MKKITFLIFIMSSALSFAQQVVIQDFDTPATYTFAGFEGLGSATIQPDPVSGGTRLNGLRLVSVSTGNPWQGAEVIQSATSAKYKLTTDKTMKVDVYSTQAFTMLAKVEVGGPNSAASQAYTTPNQWQTLTFNFTQSLDGTTVANGIYEKVVFFPNWKATNDGFGTPANFTIHVDNVTSENGVTPPIAAPTTAAPTPPNRPAADVKSIFSNAYTPVAVLGYAGSDNDNTYDTTWCGATTTLVSIAGNDTNRITGLGCEGISFLSGRFDASDFTFFHMDIWTATPTQDKSFNFKFSNWNGGTGEANAFQYSATNANILPSTNPGTWISIDIPMSSFQCINTPPGNACPSKNDFTQFVITSDLGTVYYDNLYLHKNTLGVSSFETSKIKMYPNPATTNFTIEAQEAVEKVAVYNMLGQEVIAQNTNSQQVTINISTLQVGVYVVKATINGAVSTSRIIKE